MPLEVLAVLLVFSLVGLKVVPTYRLIEWGILVIVFMRNCPEYLKRRKAITFNKSKGIIRVHCTCTCTWAPIP